MHIAISHSLVFFKPYTKNGIDVIEDKKCHHDNFALITKMLDLFGVQ